MNSTNSSGRFSQPRSVATTTGVQASIQQITGLIRIRHDITKFRMAARKFSARATHNPARSFMVECHASPAPHPGAIVRPMSKTHLIVCMLAVAVLSSMATIETFRLRGATSQTEPEDYRVVRYMPLHINGQSFAQALLTANTSESVSSLFALSINGETMRQLQLLKLATFRLAAS